MRRNPEFTSSAFSSSRKKKRHIGYLSSNSMSSLQVPDHEPLFLSSMTLIAFTIGLEAYFSSSFLMFSSSVVPM